MFLRAVLVVNSVVYKPSLSIPVQHPQELFCPEIKVAVNKILFLSFFILRA